MPYTVRDPRAQARAPSLLFSFLSVSQSATGRFSVNGDEGLVCRLGDYNRGLVHAGTAPVKAGAGRLNIGRILPLPVNKLKQRLLWKTLKAVKRG